MSNQPLNNNDPAGLLLTARTLTKSVDALTAQVNRYKHRTIILAVSLALDLLLTTGLTILGFNVRDVADCQAQQSAAFHTAVNRARAARDKQDDQQLGLQNAQLALANAIANPSSTPTQKKAALNTYRQAVLANQTAILATRKASADNPIPNGKCT